RRNRNLGLFGDFVNSHGIYDPPRATRALQLTILINGAPGVFVSETKQLTSACAQSSSEGRMHIYAGLALAVGCAGHLNADRMRFSRRYRLTKRILPARCRRSWLMSESQLVH